MEFSRYKLEQTNQGYVLHLYLDPSLEEFASELGTRSKEEQKDFRRSISEFVGKKFPGINISVAKIMIGTTLVTTIPLQMDTNNHASAADNGFNMSYLFSGSTSTFLNEVNKTKGNLDVVAPSYFELKSDGSLNVTNQFDPSFISAMHNQNIKVVPFLGNNWDRTIGRAALANREALSTQIADFITKNNLDGVNIDIENVTEVDRDNYTDFIRLLRQKVPSGKEVSVAVAANPYHWKSGWQASYNNAELAKYADYLMLMAYDESWNGSPSGPVAELSWVEKSVKALVVDDGVPANKVVLGLPFYGRYWNRSESFGGYGIPDYQVASLVTKYNGTTTYDEATQSAKATFTINPGDPTTVVGGRTLTPGTYDVWYEDNESLHAKINLVHKYQLKGTGSWALGQEDTSLWNNFGIWLSQYSDPTPVDNPNAPAVMPFVDARTHWAHDEILYATQKGWFHGQSSNEFAPNKSLTRAEAAQLFVNVLNLKPLKPIVHSSFPDVHDSYWAKDAIEIAYQHGLFQGSDDGKFHPTDQLTREQMAEVFDNVFNAVYDPTKTSEHVAYNDVSPNRWSYHAIVNMKQQGFFSGVDANHFAPKQPLTRAQAAVVLTNATDHIHKLRGETLFPNMLQAGSQGADVTLLQIYLKKLGLTTNQATGVFDSKTDQVVRTFQKNQGLSIDGIAGPNTIKALLGKVNQ